MGGSVGMMFMPEKHEEFTWLRKIEIIVLNCSMEK